ncbi:unnamed protein product [Owenia fusiformis]|uniref:Uncharacterized protein n=1 Tax=Owenia fusiformis TaxID=6347 RepID=A0A8S4Q1B8_OWEFU|nr:unnamed protein product [Owenia fusiformis]
MDWLKPNARSQNGRHTHHTPRCMKCAMKEHAEKERRAKLAKSWEVPKVPMLNNSRAAEDNCINKGTLYEENVTENLSKLTDDSPILPPLKTSPRMEIIINDTQLENEKRVIRKYNRRQRPESKYESDDLIFPSAYKSFLDEPGQKNKYMYKMYLEEVKARHRDAPVPSVAVSGSRITIPSGCSEDVPFQDELYPEGHNCDLTGKRTCKQCIEHRDKAFAKEHEQQLIDAAMNGDKPSRHSYNPSPFQRVRNRRINNAKTIEPTYVGKKNNYIAFPGMTSNIKRRLSLSVKREVGEDDKNGCIQQ